MLNTTAPEFEIPTPDQIVVHLRASDSAFGWDAGVLVPFLPFGLAQEWLKPEITREQWTATPPLEPRSHSR